MDDEGSIERQLRADGFTDIRTQRDSPGIHYPPHTHPIVTAHVILEGSMELMLGEQRDVLKSGDRFDVPANTVHEARIGPEGCTYVIGT